MNLSVFLRALAGSALGLALLLGLPVLAAPATQGATFTVDIAEDAIDADSTDGLCRTESDVCTLRAAVMQANALPGEDTIEIPQRFSASLSLTGAGEDDSVTGDLDIRDDLSIQGVSLIVSGIEAGQLEDRALHVHPGVHLTLLDVSVAWANAGNQDGGGLLNEGTVSIVASSLQFNTADRGGGVMNLGELSLTRSVIGYNHAAEGGGGILNDGVATVDRSTIASNEVANGPGGGIDNRGTLVLRNSTVSQNRAAWLAGAIYNRDQALARFNNAAIHINAVLPGGPSIRSTGGIFNEPSGSVEIGNSIVAPNAAPDADNNLVEADCMGTIESTGYNLFGSDTDCTITGDVTRNLIGLDPMIPSSPTLDPADTWGYPPLPGSPAIDAGNPAPPGSGGAACETIDQRGLSRPQGAACDIGAYEFEAPTPTPTPTGTSTLTPTPTATSTATPTVTSTATPTVTSTATPTATSTATPTATATLSPASPAEAIRAIQADILDYIADGRIHPRAEKSLMSKLDAALKSLSKGNTRAAARQLGAFIQLLEAQQGKRIAEAAADDLIAQAKAVIGQIERTSSGR